jgi:hypothetical protein
MKSANFEILRERWPELASLGGFAEAYIFDDPASALVKLRLYAENLTKDIYRDLALPKPDHATFVDLLSNQSFAAITDLATAYPFASFALIAKVSSSKVGQRASSKSAPRSFSDALRVRCRTCCDGSRLGHV